MLKIEAQVRQTIKKMSMADLLKFQTILNTQKDQLSYQFGADAWDICMDLVQARILKN